MNTDVLVRKVQHGDSPQWLRLWDGYNAFYGRTGASALPAEVTAETWARFFNPHEPMHALVAESAGTLVGLAHFLFHRSTSSIAPICYLQDLFTADRSRGRGVATALVLRVCEAAKQAGAPRVYWQTHESNDTARRLYDKIAERSGFIIYRNVV